ncbi:putative acetyltransferase, GNAT family [Xylariaceae sp. FL0016]|nr:putative acetyltransferase, GNAT family [Xylariaceae sp. FL0016]
MATRAPNPLGPSVSSAPARLPARDTKLTGQYITMAGLSPKHVDGFFPHISGDENAPLWDYMFDGPFHDLSDFRTSMEHKAVSQDPTFYAIIPKDRPTTDVGVDNVVGVASYMRMDPSHRCIEVGNIMFSPTLQRTPAATEAMYLMAKHAFEDLGYRRYEWKCNALNAPSCRAAVRLGFAFEGVFRKHMIIKGRSRDTAWYAMVDDEWPSAKHALEGWLDGSNFDGEGRQRKRLEEFRK